MARYKVPCAPASAEAPLALTRAFDKLVQIPATAVWRLCGTELAVGGHHLSVGRDVGLVAAR